LKNGTVFSMSRNELPKDETLVSTTEIHAFAFNSLHHSQFLISLLLFLVLNFPLDFVVPLDVEVESPVWSECESFRPIYQSCTDF